MGITDRAVSVLREMLQRKGASPASGLRLAVRRGGCAGWQYEMKIAEPEEGDEAVEFEGGRLLIAADSADKLRGCQVDYSDDLSDAGFRVLNPNAARSCGCGTSFEAAGEPAPAAEDLEDCGRP